MSGWIDPLGTRAILRYLSEEGRRLRDLAKKAHALHPQSHKASRYAARVSQLANVMRVVQKQVRPGAEMKPYRDLVNAGPLGAQRKPRGSAQ